MIHISYAQLWTNIAVILQLVVIEALLSFDNAVALAAYVRKHLKNPIQQKRALIWGLGGAYILRTLVLLAGVWIMKFEWTKAIAGSYLIYLAITELFFTKKAHIKKIAEKISADEAKKLPFVSNKKFWKVVIQVELMDLMFAIDSVAVALAISDKPWVLITGTALGILMMRVVAQTFLLIIDKFPILEKTAFVLVGIAGINVILKIKELNLHFTTITINKPLDEHAFLGIMLFILLASFPLNYVLYPKKKKIKN